MSAQERQQLAEERADAEAAAKRGQQAAALAQQRAAELEARVQVRQVLRAGVRQTGMLPSRNGQPLAVSKLASF